ncbi:MAG: hypothetical protein C9356_15050 [Oleiphilus sp.]|nr:MAG: hypothetical protein C9356_15050 [Oleiphilus sp.]
MLNLVCNWSWEQPAEEGQYLACYGDVETADNLELMDLVYRERSGQTMLFCLKTEQFVADLSTSVKYGRLVFSKSRYEALVSASDTQSA